MIFEEIQDRLIFGLKISLAALEDSADSDGLGTCHPLKEFLVSRHGRETYQIEDSFFKLSGNVIIPDFHSARLLAKKLEDLGTKASDINAMGLIHEIFHHVVTLYKQKTIPNLMEKALFYLEEKMGKPAIEKVLHEFVRLFPPQTVFQGNATAEEYTAAHSNGVPHRELLLEELLLLWVGNKNPAKQIFRTALFGDEKLRKTTDYHTVIDHLESFFQTQPLFGPKQQNLIGLLRSPAVAVPDSLPGQLDYIKNHWGLLLEEFLARLLAGLDFAKEENKFGGLGPGEIPVYDFGDDPLAREYERFSTDLHWMPRLVLMAKSTYVWLDQLSKKYKRHIHRLDHIPDEELDQLAQQGFTGLWLIGVWERSRASERIKQICGNPEAMASAYSIYDYRIADSLGGEAALENLAHRAGQRGIRMAGDMVPNHMGLDSPWLVHHPDWFLYLDHCPYPSYSFNGENLSSDSRISIFLEDHYYDRTDAAVVFKWVNNHSGEVRYIYHGNDGTSMPWNDTAQLNYLNPDVREAVTNTIFSVSKWFPIIRFDAAMIQTRKHYQRLWFPEPGSGGDIPTRAGKGMSKHQFHTTMPNEFWRDVVDRFSSAGSNTLLLAEAFWLMEAFFVRTLGMHRVYNSAFMNFLKSEDNKKFRHSIKNVLTFNPEILKRFVNFLNNPDEETAVAQFGKDDKYFGVTTLMATLPGLPMFGHGQIEGFTEKYGMEYRRAYKDEKPDPWLLDRHEREIFPLLRQRRLFAHVDNFLLYDFYTGDGHVDENVIAFSNNQEGERSLVIYHNTYAETSGWLNMSVPFLPYQTTTPVMHNLAYGLQLQNRKECFVTFRDQVTGLQYIRNCKDLHSHGLFVELNAFKRYVFLEFEEVEDCAEYYYGGVTALLDGKGVESVEELIRQRYKNPLKKPFQALLRQLKRASGLKPDDPAENFLPNLEAFLKPMLEIAGSTGKIEPLVRLTNLRLESILDRSAQWSLQAHREIIPAIMLHTIDETLQSVMEYSQMSPKPSIWKLLDDWLLTEDIEKFLKDWGLKDHSVEDLIAFTHLLIGCPQWPHFFPDPKALKPKPWLEQFFDHPVITKTMQVNDYEGVVWFNKEAADSLFQHLYLAASLLLVPVSGNLDLLERLQKAVDDSGYKLKRLIEILKEQYKIEEKK